MPAVSAAPAVPVPAPPRTLGAGLLLTVLVVAFESMAVGTVLPRVADELRGLALYGWASSAFLLSSLFGAVLGGVLGDRRGLMWSAGFSLAVFAAGLLVGGLAPTMTVFVLGRLIQGLGAGGLGALPFAVITTRYPEAQRARMLAAVSSAWLLPALVGPLIASLIADLWSWRTVFWGLVPVLALVAPLCLWPLRGPAPRVGGRAESQTALLWPALGLAASAGALVEGLRSPGLLGGGLVALGAAGTALTARRLFPVGLLRFAGGLPTALAVRGLAAFALLGTNSFLPLALNELRGLSLTAAGWVLSLGGATWTLGSWVQAQVERRLGAESRPLRVRVGLGLMATGLLTSALAVLGGLPLWAVYPAWVLACLGMGVGYNSNSLYALAAADPGESGRLSGQLANIEVLCVAVAAGVGGALIARLPLERAFTVAFGVTLLAAVLGWLAAGRLRRG
ncbi:MFS transporter [Deinococcus sp. SDU3-2]|uniref:MFS transporter n=1 Tax=Deinococcus terrestris TaxID=2651870 RepID=A0A7X1TQ95_9DEIO|nr:MFS transporter [Deinococcus terrestris]MPY65425.1 MFS transporter [Deinococcus terrestris]